MIECRTMGNFEPIYEKDIYSILTLDKVKQICFNENDGRHESEFSWITKQTKSSFDKNNIPKVTEYEIWQIAKRTSRGETPKYIKEYLEQWKYNEIKKRNPYLSIDFTYSISVQRIKDIVKLIEVVK